ncbi:MAG: hypothetical protein IPJ32_01170 [Sphingobacteriaceae bacterium]|nr:hypothetical protein [Sphingobacteriaceae bacterium]
MKKLFLLATVITAAISSAFILAPAFDELAINSAVPEASYKMKDVSGKEVSLDEAKTAKGLLVIFSCNTCPYVKLSETRIKSTVIIVLQMVLVV